MQNTKSLTELLSRHEYKAGTVEDQILVTVLGSIL